MTMEAKAKDFSPLPALSSRIEWELLLAGSLHPFTDDITRDQRQVDGCV